MKNKLLIAKPQQISVEDLPLKVSGRFPVIDIGVIFGMKVFDIIAASPGNNIRMASADSRIVLYEIIYIALLLADPVYRLVNRDRLPCQNTKKGRITQALLLTEQSRSLPSAPLSYVPSAP